MSPATLPPNARALRLVRDSDTTTIATAPPTRTTRQQMIDILYDYSLLLQVLREDGLVTEDQGRAAVLRMYRDYCTVDFNEDQIAALWDWLFCAGPYPFTE